MKIETIHLIATFASVISTCSYMPQAYRIYSTKSVHDLSIHSVILRLASLLLIAISLAMLNSYHAAIVVFVGVVLNVFILLGKILFEHAK